MSRSLAALSAVLACVSVVAKAVGQAAGAPGELGREKQAEQVGEQGSQAASREQSVQSPSVRNKVRFSADVADVRVRAGDSVQIALTFRMPPKWHIYWRGFNETGTPPTWTIQLPEAWRTAANLPGPVQGELAPQLWPAPTRYVSAAETVDSAYFGTLTLVQSLPVPKGLQPGVYTLQVDASWLVCEDACIPEDASSSVTMQVLGDANAKEGDGNDDAMPPAMPSTDQQSDAMRALVRSMEASIAARPTPLSPALASELGLSVERDGGTLRIGAKSATSLAFLPSDASLPFANLLDTTIATRTQAGELSLTLTVDEDLAKGMREQLGLRAEGEDDAEKNAENGSARTADAGAALVQAGKLEGIVLVVVGGQRRAVWVSLAGK
jgi:DsbC/DsbD-like thiol-disulfide interchange protein